MSRFVKHIKGGRLPEADRLDDVAEATYEVGYAEDKLITIGAGSNIVFAAQNSENGDKLLGQFNSPADATNPRSDREEFIEALDAACDIFGRDIQNSRLYVLGGSLPTIHGDTRYSIARSFEVAAKMVRERLPGLDLYVERTPEEHYIDVTLRGTGELPLVRLQDYEKDIE